MYGLYVTCSKWHIWYRAARARVCHRSEIFCSLPTHTQVSCLLLRHLPHPRFIQCLNPAPLQVESYIMRQ